MGKIVKNLEQTQKRIAKNIYGMVNTGLRFSFPVPEGFSNENSLDQNSTVLYYYNSRSLASFGISDLIWLRNRSKSSNPTRNTCSWPASMQSARLP